MQCHPSTFRRRLLIWSVTLVAPPVSAVLAQGEPPSPWTTAERVNALVYIEAPGPSVATGFIVDGHGGKQYVATVTHGLLPAATEQQLEAFDPDDCRPLPDNTTLFQGNRGGSPLRPDCGAYHIGNDVSLVELSPGTSPWPALPFLACDLVPGDDVYLGGFALGLDRITMVGKVRGNGRRGTIITDSLTAGGLSGGPYLTADGNVVGIHQGILANSPGYATILPVQALRTKLEVLLPQVETQDECPKPVMEAQTVKAELAVLEKELDELAALLGVKPDDDTPKAPLDQRIQAVEAVIDELRNEIQWELVASERAGIPVVVVHYRRMVAGPPPADRLELTVKAVTTPPAPQNLEQKVYIYPDEEIKEVQGKSGKYEVALRSVLGEIALGYQMPVREVRLNLTNGIDVLASTAFALSKPVEP